MPPRCTPVPLDRLIPLKSGECWAGTVLRPAEMRRGGPCQACPPPALAEIPREGDGDGSEIHGYIETPDL